jgi:hypothetical protein
VGAEALLRAPQVGADVVGAEALGLPRAEDDVEPLGHPALNRGDLVRVPRELEHRGGLRAARELGVVRLVAPRAELRRLVDPDDEVGPPAPALPRERRLVDHVRTRAHRVDRRSVRALECAGLFRKLDRDDLASSRPQPGEVGGLVGVALLGDQVGERLPAERLSPLAARDLELQRRQVRAG